MKIFERRKVSLEWLRHKGKAMKHRAFSLITLFILLFIPACTPLSAAPAPLELRDRIASIPAGKLKVLPEEDEYPPILHDAAWEEPLPLGSPVNTAGLEDSPFITPDGQILLFFFTPSADIGAVQQVGDGVTGIYISRWSQQGWSAPQRVLLSSAGQIALDGCPTLSGDTLWFCSSRAGNYRDIDIWTARRQDGDWVEVENAGEILNQELAIGEMHIAADSSQLFYHAPQSSTESNLDIWQLSAVNGVWGSPVNVRAVNSGEDDSRPALSPDGQELWFTRTYQGAPAIFRSLLVDGEWQPPALIISHFAGEPSLDQAGNIYFVHHFYKDGKMLEADIYIAKRINGGK